jgi:hypothetical protein
LPRPWHPRIAVEQSASDFHRIDAVLAGDGEVRVSIARACSAMTAAWAAMVASRSGVESGDGIVASGLRHCLR